MTLVLSVQTKESIWIVADRRLSANRAVLSDSAVKTTVLETSDGIALLGYAGLGSTPVFRNQPSQWVSNVLRGRNLPLEQMLQIIVEAMNREFPRHLNGIQKVQQRNHVFLVPAIVDNQTRFYSIVLFHTPKGYQHSFKRHIIPKLPGTLMLPIPFGVAGTGSDAIKRKKWGRETLRLVAAYNKKRISSRVVSSHFSKTVARASVDTKDGSVGPDCIVIWRNANATARAIEDGGFEYFANGQPATGRKTVPQIVRGMDMAAFANIFVQQVAPKMFNLLNSLKEGEVYQSSKNENDRDREQLNKKLQKLPRKPDEKLR